MSASTASQRFASLPGPLWVPRERDGFIGRTRELAEVIRLLGESALVTLAGPGVRGQDAAGAAPGARGHRPAGVRLVELAAVADPALVEHAVASGLGINEERGVAVVDTLCTVLGSVSCCWCSTTANIS